MNKAKISKDGHLEIERAGKFKEQRCPIAGADEEGGYCLSCGDWCPLFHEHELIDGVLSVSIGCDSVNPAFTIAIDERPYHE